MRLALAAVAALALAAAGCGGVENEPNLARAAEKTEASGSFALELTTGFEGLDPEFDTSCAGVVDVLRQRSRLTCAEYETIAVEGTLYQRHPDTGDTWWRLPGAVEDVAAEYSPERMLGVARAASLRTERIGHEDVRRERAVRYAITVDCERAPDLCVEDTGVVDVWIDSDGLVRRIATDDDGVATRTEFFDFGAPVAVEAPPAKQVVELTDALACTADLESPIRIEHASAAFRRHGFDVRRDDSLCGPTLGTALTNAPANGGVEDVLRRDGYLSCTVRATPPDNGIWFVLRPAWPGEPSPRVERQLENLECTLFVDRARADERTAALDAAIAELKRELRP